MQDVGLRIGAGYLMERPSTLRVAESTPCFGTKQASQSVRIRVLSNAAHTEKSKVYFYRVSIPQDIQNGNPKPTTWTTSSASLAPAACDPFKYFYNHSLIFGESQSKSAFECNTQLLVTDITFCGDWAGNSYATTPGCSGTCQDHLMDPSNFVVSGLISNFHALTHSTLECVMGY